jgi:hypothetical protein
MGRAERCAPSLAGGGALPPCTRRRTSFCSPVWMKLTRHSADRPRRKSYSASFMTSTTRCFYRLQGSRWPNILSAPAPGYRKQRGVYQGIRRAGGHRRAATVTTRGSAGILAGGHCTPGRSGRGGGTVVNAKSQISEAAIQAVLEACCGSFLPPSMRFHSDTGSEFINHFVA